MAPERDAAVTTEFRGARVFQEKRGPNFLYPACFHYSAPAYLGMSPLIWRKIDSFFSKTLKSIFGHPGFVKNELVMNNYLGKRASDIIIDQATNIIRNILHVR